MDTMKILIISDIHGKHESFQNGITEFENGDYDKIIQLGDLVDSYDRSNEDILRCINLSIKCKEKYGEKFIQLIGNHEWSYFVGLNICSGFRPDLNITLNPLLNSIRSMWQICFQEKNYLFTHAGIQRKWFIKNLDTLNQASTNYGLPEITRFNFEPLNSLIWTSDEYRIAEVGMKRGGMRGDYGGPLWCDKDEMLSYGPIKDLHQIVGHTPIPFIERIEKFEGGKQYNNTSVTFCDILQKKEEFYKLEI